MREKAFHYFVNSNSSRGFVSFLDSNLQGIQNMVWLNGYSGSMMFRLADRVCKSADQKEAQVHIIRNCLDNSIDGVLIPSCSAGVLNRPVSDETPESVFAVLQTKPLQKIRSSLQEARGHFETARGIHDEWEQIYISRMQFQELDEMSNELMEILFQNSEEKAGGNIVHRFFGAATAQGSVDYIENLTEPLRKRYFLKGRPGTGKSTFLKKIAAKAEACGYQTELYHCAFDPNSADLVAIRNLSVCVFDSTAPHEYFPTRATDEIIDIYERAVQPHTDELCEKELADVSARYRAEVKKATACLKQAKEAYDTVQETLDQAASSEREECIHQEILKRLLLL